MKTVFSINSLVALALPQVTDTDKLTQACEAYLNGMHALSSESNRGGLRESKKNNDARVIETVATTYTGERNVVSDFLQWHDRVVSWVAKGEKIGCVGNVGEVPPRFANWLAKFAKADKATDAKPTAKRNPKRNGQTSIDTKPTEPATAPVA